MLLGSGPESNPPPRPTPRCFSLPRDLPPPRGPAGMPRHARILPDVLGITKMLSLPRPELWDSGELGGCPGPQQGGFRVLLVAVNLCEPAFGARIGRRCFSQNAGFYFAATKCPTSLFFVQFFKCQHEMVLP